MSSQFSLRLHDSTINDHCSVGQLLLIQLDTTPIFLFVCIYELIIFPLFGKFTPSILRKIGIGMIVGILAIVSLFVLDGYGHSNYTSPSFNWTANSSCYLVDETPIFEIDIKATWVSVPYLLSALSETIVFIAGWWLYIVHTRILAVYTASSSYIPIPKIFLPKIHEAIIIAYT